jgi:glutamate carboxypeptidase
MAGLAPAQPVRLLVSADAQQGHPTSRGYLTAESARAGAVFGLGQPGADGSLVIGRPGAVRVVLTVTGAGAVDELIGALGRARVGLGPGALLNVGRIGGGLAPYDVPDLAAAELGLAVADAEAERVALAAFAALRPSRDGATVVAEALGQVPAWPAPAANPLLEWVRSIGGRYGLTIAGTAGGAASDANHAGAHGAPTVDGFGGVGVRFRGASGSREHVRLDSLVPRAMLLAALLAQPLPIAG